MIRFAAAFCACLSTPLCAQTDPSAWRLVLLDGAAPDFVATLSLDKPGHVRGRGPCNGFSAPMTADLPAFKVEAILSTKMACPDLAAEQRFFDLLRQMDHAEHTADRLILSGAGYVMEFAPQP